MIFVVVFCRSFDAPLNPDSPTISEALHKLQMKTLQDFLQEIASKGIFGVDDQVDDVYQAIPGLLKNFAKTFICFAVSSFIKGFTDIDIAKFISDVVIDLSFVSPNLGAEVQSWIDGCFNAETQQPIGIGLPWDVEQVFIPDSIPFFSNPTTNPPFFIIDKLVN